jgi:hypothetical protein
MAIQQSNLPDDSRHVNVSYENNSIILRGTVASDKDRSEIGGMAEKCGCINIKNEIKVIPPTKKYATTTIVIPQPPSATAKTTPEKEPPKATEKTTEKSSATSTAPKTVK